jgi:hypothetical protein
MESAFFSRSYRVAWPEESDSDHGYGYFLSDEARATRDENVLLQLNTAATKQNMAQSPRL